MLEKLVKIFDDLSSSRLFLAALLFAVFLGGILAVGYNRTQTGLIGRLERENTELRSRVGDLEQTLEGYNDAARHIAERATEDIENIKSAKDAVNSLRMLLGDLERIYTGD